MDFIEDKVREYLLGDTGGKRFPVGEPPSLKDFVKKTLGRHVRLWRMQKLILKTIVNTSGQFPAIPLTPDEQAELDQMIENGKNPVGDAKYKQAVVRRNPNSKSPMVALLLIGRGGSKSFMCSLLVAYFIRFLLSFKDPHRWFGLAKTKPIAIQCLAGKQDQAVSLFRSVKTHVRNDDEMTGCFDELKESMNFGNVVEARAYTSNANTVRGEDTFCYYHEETAFCHEDNPESEKSFTQCYVAIGPAVKNRFGKFGIMLFASSAGLKIGKTYQLYRQIKNGLIQNCVMFQLAIWEINPRYAGKEDFQQEYDEDPVTADAEHGSQFVDAVNVFLSESEVNRSINRNLKKQYEGSHEKEYWIRIDPSRKHDRYAIAVGHKEYRNDEGRERIVAVVDYIHYWQAVWKDKDGAVIENPTMSQKASAVCTPVNPQVALAHIEELIQKFNVIGVSADQFESQYIVDELNERYGSEEYPFGFIIPITEKLNWLAYRNLKKMINTDCVEIYPEKAYIEEASVAMRYNKNKPVETKPDDLYSGFDEDDESEDKIDAPNLIYSVAAPRSGAVKTDDVLDAVAFLVWDMMTNPRMGVSGMDMLVAGVASKEQGIMSNRRNNDVERVIKPESPLMELPEKW